jgi:hypothetical protein
VSTDTGFAQRLWSAVDRILALEPSDPDLVTHRIEPLAARRYRALGQDVPPRIAEGELQAGIATVAAPVLLRRIREAVDGPLVLFKGPELAARYPEDGLRAFWDVDLLVPDPDAAQHALLAAGFDLVGEPELYIGIHHLRPLALPELPLNVELHAAPKWPHELPSPPVQELLDAAVPSALGLDGIDALAPEHHVLALAAHSWAHEPLRRLGDVFDLAVASEGCDPGELTATARRWGMGRLWRTTQEAVEATMAGSALRGPVRLWAGSLERGRERTVLQSHATRLLSGFSMLPPRRAARYLPGTLIREVLPDDEPWHEKARRSLRALRTPSRARSEHDRAVARNR